MRRILSLTLMLAFAVPLGTASASSTDLLVLVSRPSVSVQIDDDGVADCIRDDAFVFSVGAPDADRVEVQLTVSGVEDSNLGSSYQVTRTAVGDAVVFPWDGTGFLGKQGAYGAVALAQAYDAGGELLAWQQVSFAGYQDHRAPELNMQHPAEGAVSIGVPAQVRAGFDEVMVSGYLEVTSSVSGPIRGELIVGAAEMTLDPEPPVLLGELTISGYALDAWCNIGSFAWTGGPMIAAG